MVYSWHEPLENEAFHPRLDPVSAWLFQRHSAFLRSGDNTGDAAMLYGMGIDARGFDPAVPDAWRALSMANPVDQVSFDGHPFSTDQLQPSLGAQLHEIPDARVSVLPLPDGGPRPADILRSNRGIGTPDITQPDTPMPRPRAIIGVIDHGINIFHHRFRRGQTDSRVGFAWMQGAARREEDRIRFGREWTQPEIEAAQAAAGPDEDALLRLIGAGFERPGYRPLAFRTSHGTHVLDLAAGVDPDDASGADYPIIAVTLPPEVTRETSGSMLAVPFAMALEYIADRARWIMRAHGAIAPVYVNFSFGLSGGPRRGLHRLEQTITNVAAHHQAQVNDLVGPGVAPLTVVTAAGNNNLARGHAQAQPGAGHLDLRWQIQPADPSANFLELRIALGAAQEDESHAFDLDLTPPGADAPLTVSDAGSPGTIRFLRRGEAIIGQMSAWRNPEGIIVVTLAIEATDPGPDARAVAPAGEWQVSLRSVSAAPDRIDAWILRDDVPGGFRDTGRQSYFVDPVYSDRDVRGFLRTQDTPLDGATIRRAGTLNALATGQRDTDDTAPQAAHCWVVGGYMQENHRGGAPVPASYSAAPLEALGEAVDLSAPSDRSLVRSGIRAAGTRSGSKAVLSGTSVAAPQVLRHFAFGTGALEATSEQPRLGRHVVVPD
ncbi:S8/S53 family peptidase [Arenibacterium sp. CAU 1754]